MPDCQYHHFLCVISQQKPKSEICIKILDNYTYYYSIIASKITYE